ncbi:MAG: SRPBCC domain-containing protein [Acidobacteria bacterium]|nr:SRPBCC domain-containing protein [Acidobacteriota bacterium]MBV9071473.1 SRPBCC domain-containing protein [Acidobacteriota bacterium]MBV9185871.1 SRPBCC domain-containing protein [Acidobacteriota bacterium]
MHATIESSSDTAAREIATTRVFDAPRELVFDAWTSPEHVGQWWGPNGFTTTTHSMDVRPGGEWIFVMHGPDGTDYKNHIVYREVVRPDRIVYDHVSGPLFRATVIFEAEGQKTRIRMQMLFETAELRKKVAEEYGAVEGLEQTLNHLGEHVAKMADDEFVISREFDARRDLVFKAWTEPERLAQWWGPKGFTVKVANIDLRPGGMFHYGMVAPDGSEMWGKFIYREIVPPERMVFIVSFSDESGGTTRHPMAPTWPLEMLNTVTLTEHGDKTTLTLRSSAYAATEEERATFKAGHSSMQGGFTGTFDQLAAYLATA